ncbi:permease [Streptomyces sp. NPDC002896]|uniref:permease n=1 Tax=Streptomyces sp. NPDC002896 TaxID=3154438 RepID=UPI00332B09B8
MVTVTGGVLLAVVALVAVTIGPTLLLQFDTPAFQAWRTVFVAITVQGLPFLLFGTLISAAISAFVPASVFDRLLPRRPALAVPVAGAAGMVLPGCECASVPVAGSLMRRGVTPAAALAFLLSAPAINPVVLVATSIAFPSNPEMVLARFVASLAVSMVMGWLWIALGRPEWLRLPKPTAGPPGHGGPGQDGAGPATADRAGRWDDFRQAVQHDFLHAGGFLVVGAMAAATFNIVVPQSALDAVSGSAWLSVVLLAFLAVVLAVCSEADAFVAASLTGFSPTAKLAFMVVGPMVDVKLVALQAGTFGRAFAIRFSTVTFAVAVLCSALVGWWLL